MIIPCSDVVTRLILDEERRLRRLARRLTRCEADAEDLVQNTLLRAYRARDRFQPGTSIHAWTATILRRVFLTDVLRTKRRGLENDTDAGGPLDRVPDETRPETLDAKPTYPRLLETLEDPVKKALERVPDVYREPFLMSVVEDMTCSEIAERIGVPEGTVMSRIHRARERIKSRLVHSQSPRRLDLGGRDRPNAAA
jgi:RNA polymerase sigma-70 factor (ECF subfamily)